MTAPAAISAKTPRFAGDPPLSGSPAATPNPPEQFSRLIDQALAGEDQPAPPRSKTESGPARSWRKPGLQEARPRGPLALRTLTRPESPTSTVAGTPPASLGDSSAAEPPLPMVHRPKAHPTGKVPAPTGARPKCTGSESPPNPSRGQIPSLAPESGARIDGPSTATQAESTVSAPPVGGRSEAMRTVAATSPGGIDDAGALSPAGAASCATHAKDSAPQTKPPSTSGGAARLPRASAPIRAAPGTRRAPAHDADSHPPFKTSDPTLDLAPNGTPLDSLPEFKQGGNTQLCSHADKKTVAPESTRSKHESAGRAAQFVAIPPDPLMVLVALSQLPVEGKRIGPGAPAGPSDKQATGPMAKPDTCDPSAGFPPASGAVSPEVSSGSRTARGPDPRSAGERPVALSAAPTAGQTETAAPAAKPEKPVVEPAVNAAMAERSARPSADFKSRLHPPADFAGTSAAPSEPLVKTADKMEKRAALAEKELPPAVFSAAVPPATAATHSRRGLAALASREAPGSASQSANSSPLPAAHLASSGPAAMTVGPLAAAHEPRPAVLDRLEPLMSPHIQRCRQLGADSLSVVLRPDAQTELLLKVSLREGRVEAQVELQTGNYAALSSQWPELQQKLASQGVGLHPLGRHPGLMENGGGAGFDQLPHPAPRHESGLEQAALPWARAGTKTEMSAPAARVAAARLGWESWA